MDHHEILALPVAITFPEKLWLKKLTFDDFLHGYDLLVS